MNATEPTFKKCPYRDRCFREGCANFTSGPLCAVCIANFYQNTASQCVKCTGGLIISKIGLLIGFLFLFFSILYWQRKRIQRLRAKYGRAWRDVIRIITINLSFAQISSSLPFIIAVPWPFNYLHFLEFFSFVNIDVVSLVGLSCADENLWDFRGRLLLACFVPPMVVLICFIMYIMRVAYSNQRFHHNEISKQEMTTRSIEYLWDMFDADGSGELDEDEFHHLLVRLKASPEHVHPDNKAMRCVIMKDLKAVNHHHPHHPHHHHVTSSTLVVLRPQFVQMVASGNLGTALREDWILWAEKERSREQFLSDMLLVLFLLHAPLSQRGFYFFACTDVGGKMFLVSDYSIECYTSKHLPFVPVAIIFLVLFSFLLPIAVLFKLCRHRKKLHSPEIRHKFGFLYASFNPGGEYWEIHEIFRKLLLTGLLVFVPVQFRSVVAIFVSVLCVASLNFVKPHKSWLVFWVAQGSYVLTTFKYLTVLLLSTESNNSNIDSDSKTDGSNADMTGVGTMLVTLDLIFLLGSLMSVAAVLYVLHTALHAEEKQLNILKVAPSAREPNGSDNSGNGVVSRWALFDHKKAMEHAKVEEKVAETQLASRRAKDKAIKLVEKNKRVAHEKLMSRVTRRHTLQQKKKIQLIHHTKNAKSGDVAIASKKHTSNSSELNEARKIQLFLATEVGRATILKGCIKLAVKGCEDGSLLDRRKVACFLRKFKASKKASNAILLAMGGKPNEPICKENFLSWCCAA
jgi:hypothetical protein